ncbi:hypothetical protein SSPIM334S_02384 [Streptomyces spiroverticillatus]
MSRVDRAIAVALLVFAGMLVVMGAGCIWLP